MKRVFALCMALVLSFVIVGSCAETKKTDDYIYEKKGKGIRILSYKGNESDVLEVPVEIDGLPVRIIAENAFEFTTASKIVLPETLVTVEAFAFHAVESTDIIFSETQSKLTVEEYAFWAGNIENVHFPSTVVFKKDRPFTQCSSLKTISIDQNSKTYETIENALITKKDKKLIAYPVGAVENETITIPDGVKIIGNSVFELMKTARAVIIPDSVIELGNSCFYNSLSLESVKIGSGIKKWGNSVFAHCHNLKRVVIDEGTKKIGKEAFMDCEKLETITIPKTVTDIGRDIFKGNYTLKIIAEENSIAGKYAKKNGLELVAP